MLSHGLDHGLDRGSVQGNLRHAGRDYAGAGVFRYSEAVTSQYPKDEFDRAGEDMPQGMHLQQPSRWKSVWPFLAVLVIVPAAAWGISHILTSGGAQQKTTTSVSTTATTQAPAASATTEATQTPSATPTTSETPSPSPSIPVRHSAKISVLNGTGTQGLAAQKVSALSSAGFDGATAANARGWDTEVSTVYYEDPNLKATAEEVAKVLGISRVQQTQTGDPDVVVVLK